MILKVVDTGWATILPTRNEMRLSMESSTSSLVLEGSCLCCSMYFACSRRRSRNVHGVQ